MTDRDIITHLATKVMGWELRALALTSGIFDAPHGRVYHWPNSWNPLESHDDSAQVQAVILASPKGNDYVLRLHDAACKGVAVITMQRLLRFMLTATPRQKCIAAVEDTL